MLAMLCMGNFFSRNTSLTLYITRNKAHSEDEGWLQSNFVNTIFSYFCYWI